MKQEVHSVSNINATSMPLAGEKTNNDLHIVHYCSLQSYPRVDAGVDSILASGPATSSST